MRNIDFLKVIGMEESREVKRLEEVDGYIDPAKTKIVEHKGSKLVLGEFSYHLRIATSEGQEFLVKVANEDWEEKIEPFLEQIFPPPPKEQET